MPPNLIMRHILSDNKNDLALIIGNGINRYGRKSDDNSWETLLRHLAETCGQGSLAIPKGISPTEFYDILDLKKDREISELNLQKQFCDSMSEWGYSQHHKWIAEWSLRHSCPILTTNYENSLGASIQARLLRTTDDRSKFTDYYPWITYYGKKRISSPVDDFGVWHINGMDYYSRSVRLGLSHYMGSVSRARAWLHRGKGKRLFASKENIQKWHGKDTWLQIFFSKPLLFFGLGLEESEVFLRWLLIERARFFRKFPNLTKPAWYCSIRNEFKTGKAFFLESVGIKPVEIKTYSDIYGAKIWEY